MQDWNCWWGMRVPFSVQARRPSSRGPRVFAATPGKALAVQPLGEFLDHLAVEGGNVVGPAARHHPAIDHDLLVDPGRARILQVGLERRPRRHAAPLERAGFDESPGTVADD